MRRLFLDDMRHPSREMEYMSMRIGQKYHEYANEEWEVVKDYHSFVRHIKGYGMPDLISFDHDLGYAHYGITSEKSWEDYHNREDREYTGYDAAKWLCIYCSENSIPLPKYYVHTMNNVGYKNILDLLDNYVRTH
jgi:hypothetical protein